MSEFGARFKRARLSRGASLDQIAAETRIGVRFLQAIENEDFHLLPGGIFNRGFIRSYAERVGLDAERAVDDYKKLVKRPEPEDLVISAKRPSSKAETGLYTVAAAILALAIVISYVVMRSSQPLVIEDINPLMPDPLAPPGQLQEPPAPAPVPGPAEFVPEPAPLVLAVEMEIHERTWIKLVMDGQEVLSGEVLQPGTTRRYTAHASIDIRIGNAGGIVLRVNDRPVGVLGRSGQVRELSITPENLNDIFG